MEEFFTTITCDLIKYYYLNSLKLSEALYEKHLKGLFKSLPIDEKFQKIIEANSKINVLTINNNINKNYNEEELFNYYLIT